MDDPRDDPCEPRDEPREPREELCDPRESLPEEREDPRDEFGRGEAVRVVTLCREELPPLPPEKISCKRAWIAGALVEVMISIDWTLRASTISTSCSTSENS